MMIFHVKYSSGATFVKKLPINSIGKIWYYMELFRQDPSVQRVLAEVQ